MQSKRTVFSFLISLAFFESGFSCRRELSGISLCYSWRLSKVRLSALCLGPFGVATLDQTQDTEHWTIQISIWLRETVEGESYLTKNFFSFNFFKGSGLLFYIFIVLNVCNVRERSCRIFSEWEQNETFSVIFVRQNKCIYMQWGVVIVKDSWIRPLQCYQISRFCEY